MCANSMTFSHCCLLAHSNLARPARQDEKLRLSKGIAFPGLCKFRSLHCARGAMQRRAAFKYDEKGEITVVGSVNVDTVLQVDRMPKEGETLSAHALYQFPGGKGANQAVAASRLGCEATMVGQVGDDAGADFMISSLSANGVHYHGTVVKKANQSTGCAVVMLLPGGENSIIISGGANTVSWELSVEQTEAIKNSKIVLLQREIPDSVNLQVARMCKEVGVEVLLDAGGAEGPLDPDLLSCISILTPNETELSRLTSMPVTSTDSVISAARSLQDCGARDVLVKLGSRGSILIPGTGDVVEKSAIAVPEVVDTTGAGDCFTSAFAVARIRAMPVSDCLHYASVAASLCIQHKGAMSSMPMDSDVKDLLNSTS